MKTQARVGRFTISLDWIDKEYDLVRRICGECVITRAETLFHPPVVEYVAICDQFDPVSLGQVIPEYEIICHREKGSKTKWQFRPKNHST